MRCTCVHVQFLFPAVGSFRAIELQKYYERNDYIAWPCILSTYLPVDIESFWTEGYAGQIPNSGHELEI